MFAAVRADRRTILVFVVVGVVLFVGLGAYGLWDPDEGRHASIARSVYDANTWRGWIVPAHNFEDYHDKPILYYWLTAAAFGALGANELAARMVPALAALGTLLAVYLWTATVWNASTARRAVLVLLTCVGFLALGRYGNLDMLFTCWLTLGIVAAERYTARPERTGLLVLAAVAAGLGMLTKGLAAPLFVVGIPLLHAWLVGRPLPRPRAWAYAAAVFLVVVSPWLVATWVVDPAYIRDFVLVHHIKRFTAEGTTFHAGPWWYYGPALVLMAFPWSLLLPPALASAVARRDAGLVLCACWAGIIVGFFSLSHGKLATYILPALPPLAILTARTLDDVAATPWRRRLTAVGLALLALTLLAVWPVTMRMDAAQWVIVVAAAQPYVALFPTFALLLAACWWRWGMGAAVRLIAPAVILLAVPFYTSVAPAVSLIVSEQSIAAAVSAHPEAPIVGYQVTPASLMFYVDRPIARVSRTQELLRALEGRPFAWIVTSPRHVHELARIVTVYPWIATGRHVLYATAPTSAVAARRDARSATE